MGVCYGSNYIHENINQVALCLPHVQWGQKVFSQPLIVQVLLLRMTREVCNFHRRYTLTMRDKMEKKMSIMVENKYLVNNKSSTQFFVTNLCWQ